jgi:predicted DNA-binding antitoxin AbrB/MazE fold protein
MSAKVEAIYEDGMLRLTKPLALPNHAKVTVTVDFPGDAADAERAEWLAASEVALRNTWDNEADDIFNELRSQ